MSGETEAGFRIVPDTGLAGLVVTLRMEGRPAKLGDGGELVDAEALSTQQLRVLDVGETVQQLSEPPERSNDVGLRALLTARDGTQGIVARDMSLVGGGD